MENNLEIQEATKYDIAERLDKLRTTRRLRIRKTIIEKLGISTSTYHRWMILKQSDRADIPGEALILFAQLLGTSVPELLTDKKPT